MRQGELCTWAKLSAIHCNCGIEATLDACIQQVRWEAKRIGSECGRAYWIRVWRWGWVISRLDASTYTGPPTPSHAATPTTGVYLGAPGAAQGSCAHRLHTFACTHYHHPPTNTLASPQVSTWERQERRKSVGAALPLKSRIPSWASLPMHMGRSASQESLPGCVPLWVGGRCR